MFAHMWTHKSMVELGLVFAVHLLYQHLCPLACLVGNLAFAASASPHALLLEMGFELQGARSSCCVAI